MPQGGGEAPKALSARVLVAAYWLFVVLNINIIIIVTTGLNNIIIIIIIAYWLFVVLNINIITTGLNNIIVNVINMIFLRF